LIESKKDKVKHLIPVALKFEELQKICIEFEFDSAKIDEYLQFLEIDEKYKNVEAYQWQETKSKEQKQMERQRKKLEAEREKYRKA